MRLGRHPGRWIGAGRGRAEMGTLLRLGRRSSALRPLPEPGQPMSAVQAQRGALQARSAPATARPATARPALQVQRQQAVAPVARARTVTKAISDVNLVVGGEQPLCC